MKRRNTLLRQFLLFVMLLTCGSTFASLRQELAFTPNVNTTEQLNSSDSAIWIRYVGTTNNGEDVDCDENNQFTVHFRVVITNDGTVELKAGDNNYSLSIIDHSNDDSVVYTQAISQTLAPDETSDTIELETKLNYDDYANGTTFYIKENLSGETKYGAFIRPIAYTAQPVYYLGSKQLRDGDVIDFGEVADSSAQTITLRNDGAKPFTLNSLTAPNGFSISYESGTLPYTIAAHESQNYEVTFNPSEAKAYSGDLVFTTDAGTMTFKLQGKGLDANLYRVDFEDNAIPVNFIRGEWSLSSVPNDMGLANNNYCVEEYSTSDTAKLITPLIHFEAEQTLSFIAAKKGSSSYLNVYTSTDRKNWTLLRQITADATDEANCFSDEQVGSGWDTYYSFKEFTLTNLNAGDQYLAFEAGGVYLDNIYGGKLVDVAHDVLPVSLTVPNEAMVNYSQSATVSFHNVNLKDEKNCTLVFPLGNESKELGSVDIKSGETITKNFKFTAHTVGTQTAYVTLTTGDYSVNSQTVDVNVVAEEVNNFVQAGENEYANSRTLIDFYYNKNISDQVYSANDINLPSGTQINSLRFKGYLEGGDVTSNIRIYMANVTDSMPDSYAPRDTTTMTKVYENTNYKIAQGGSGSSSSVENAVNLIDVNLAQPFTYDGTNLSIVVVTDNTNESGAYLRSSWQCSNKMSGIIASGSDWSSYYYTSYQPVAYLGIDKEATVLSGKVSNTEGLPLEGVEVKAENGDIVYSGTTDNTGHYEVTLLQDNATFNLTYTKPNYIPYKEEHDFTAGSYENDVVLKDADGFVVESFNIPTTGSVNAVYKAQATVLNPMAEAIPAEDYSVSLYFDNNEVAKDTPVTVESEEQATFNFSFTPHKTGSYKAYIMWKVKDELISTDTVQVTISPEIFTSTVQAGDSTNIRNSEAPVDLYYKNSEAALIYPASILNLHKGTVINRIRYRGYITDDLESLNSDITAYIANTDKEGFEDKGYTYDELEIDTTQMTRIFSGTVTFTPVGSSSNPEYIIDLEIPGGFEYTGENLLLFFSKTASDYTSAYFVSDNNYTNCTLTRGSNYELPNNFYSCYQGLPVAYFDVTNTGVATFNVVNEQGEPVDDVSITLSANDIEYYGNSVETGKYEVTVGHIENVYKAVLTASGYETYTIEEVSFEEDAAPVFNVTLKSLIPDALQTVDADKTIVSEWYVDMNGRRVSAPTQGMYIKVTTFADGTRKTHKLIIK
ncbi:MAG: carboxypeptidase regulatory-like domain-containing protein [Prevotella sp.]|jgi:hypothetical protein